MPEPLPLSDSNNLPVEESFPQPKTDPQIELHVEKTMQQHRPEHEPVEFDPDSTILQTSESPDVAPESTHKPQFAQEDQTNVPDGSNIQMYNPLDSGGGESLPDDSSNAPYLQTQSDQAPEEPPINSEKTLSDTPLKSKTEIQGLEKQSESNPAAVPVLAVRYDLKERIAEGGMGVIRRGYDHLLNRELAFKVIHDRYRDNKLVVERFLKEAEISARLQHPGIIPVHDLGTLPDGRYFLAMKLVEGKTFEKILDARRDPTQDQGQYIKICEQVCQTMAYAHQKGIIHRDLKPANIMVGSYGEVYVMDWGIAKILGDSEAKSLEVAKHILPNEDKENPFDSDDITQAGEVLGTYAYMPPEQARGRTQLDKRCDVFALGAILCEVLTGEPPYTGRTLEKLQQQAKKGNLTDAFERLQKASVDPELISLTMRCLEPHPANRLQDAGQVASAIAAYLLHVQERIQRIEMERSLAVARADAKEREKLAVQAMAEAEMRAREAAEARAKSQEQEKRSAEVLREAANEKAISERRRRRMTVLLSMLTLITCATIAIVSIITIQRGIDQKRKEDEQVRKTQIETNQMIFEALAKFDVLYEQVVVLLQKNDKVLAGERLNSASTHLDFAKQKADEPYASEDAKKQVETRYQKLSQKRKVLESTQSFLEKVYKIIPNLKEQIDDEDILRNDNTTPYSLELFYGRKAATEYQEAFRSLGIDFTQPKGQIVQQIQQLMDIQDEITKALDDWFCLDPKNPASKQFLEIALEVDGNPLRNRIRTAVLNREMEAFGPIPHEDLNTLPPSSYILLVTGLLNGNKKDISLTKMPEEALQKQKEVVQILRRGVRLYPKDFWLNMLLAEIQGAMGVEYLQECSTWFRAALALHEQSYLAHYQLGIAYFVNAEYKSAIREFEESLKKVEQINTTIDGRKIQFKTPLPHLVTSYLNLRQRPQAEEKIQEQEKSDPNSVFVLFARAHLLNDQAETRLQALNTYKRICEMAPNWGNAKGSYAFCLHLLRRDEEAKQVLEAAIQLNPGQGWLYSLRGDILFSTKKWEEGISEYRKAVDITPDDTDNLSHLGTALQIYSSQMDHPLTVEQRKQLLNEAVQAHRKTILRVPRKVSYHTALGNCFLASGKPNEAISRYQDALFLDPNDPDAINGLGRALSQASQNESEAEKLLIRAKDLEPKNAKFYLDLADFYYSQEAYDKGLPFALQATKLDPEWEDAAHLLGVLYRDNGQIEEAIAIHKKWLKIGSTESAEAYNYLGIAYSMREETWDQSKQAYEKAIQLNQTDPIYYENFGDLLFQQSTRLANGEKGALLKQAKQAYEMAQKLRINDEDKADSLNALAKIHREEGELLQAVDNHLKAIQLQPDRSEFHSQFGLTLFRQKQYDWAIAQFQLAIKKQPQNAVYHEHLGDVYLEKQDYEEAIRSFQTVLDIEKTNRWSKNQLAIAYRKIKNYPEAIRYHQEVARESADWPRARNDYALTLAEYARSLDERNNPQQAEKVFTDNIQQFPWIELRSKQIARFLEQREFSKAQIALDTLAKENPNSLDIFHLRGEVLLAQNQALEAVNEYQKALQMNPQYLESHIGMGRAFEEIADQLRKEYVDLSRSGERPKAESKLQESKKNFAQAEEAFTKALQIDPDSTSAIERLGIVFLRLAKPLEAEILYREFLAKYPNDKKGYRFLGYAMYFQGRYASAIRYLRQASLLDPSNADIWMILGRSYRKVKNITEAMYAFKTAETLLTGRKQPTADLKKEINECMDLTSLEYEADAINDRRRQNVPLKDVLTIADRLRQDLDRPLLSISLYFYVFEKTTDPNIIKTNRISAAQAAAKVSAGSGDAKGKPIGTIAPWRERSLRWLTELFKESRSTAAANQLINDPELAGVRHPFILATMSASERKSWLQFWSEVRAVQKK